MSFCESIQTRNRLRFSKEEKKFIKGMIKNVELISYVNVFYFPHF